MTPIHFYHGHQQAPSEELKGFFCEKSPSFEQRPGLFFLFSCWKDPVWAALAHSKRLDVYAYPWRSSNLDKIFCLVLLPISIRVSKAKLTRGKKGRDKCRQKEEGYCPGKRQRPARAATRSQTSASIEKVHVRSLCLLASVEMPSVFCFKALRENCCCSDLLKLHAKT